MCWRRACKCIYNQIYKGKKVGTRTILVPTKLAGYRLINFWNCGDDVWKYTMAIVLPFLDEIPNDKQSLHENGINYIVIDEKQNGEI